MLAVPPRDGVALSFGTYLQRSRALRGLSPEEVASATRLPVRVIDALESDDPAMLCDRSTALDAARACAEYIGLDPEDTALRLEHHMQRALPRPPRPPLWRRLWKRERFLWLVALATLAVCVMLFER